MTAPTTAAERIERSGPFARGLVWIAVFVGPIGAWAVHLVALAALVRVTCNTHNGWTWLMHAITAVTLAVTAGCMVFCWRLVRVGHGADESHDTPPGRMRFLGWLGLAVGAFNLALIGLEEVYTVVLHAQRCA